MAVVILDDDRLEWTSFSWSFMRQQSLVQTAGLRNNFYTNGAARIMASATLWADNPTDLAYLHGVIIPTFYAGNQIEFTPPESVISYRGSLIENLETSSAAAAGSNQLALRETDNSVFSGTLETGSWFTITGQTQIYVVNTYNTTTDTVTFAPNLRSAVTANTAINFATPKLTMEFLPDSLSIVSNSGNTNFTTISFDLAEVL